MGNIAMAWVADRLWTNRLGARSKLHRLAKPRIDPTGRSGIQCMRKCSVTIGEHERGFREYRESSEMDDFLIERIWLRGY
jgi:hypothetical protein